MLLHSQILHGMCANVWVVQNYQQLILSLQVCLNPVEKVKMTAVWQDTPGIQV